MLLDELCQYPIGSNRAVFHGFDEAPTAQCSRIDFDFVGVIFVVVVVVVVEDMGDDKLSH